MTAGRPLELRLYQVDAFSDVPFRGNPAAVVPLEAWLPDDLLQAIAAENNLSETAFFVPSGTGRHDLRWFTPATEVDLCGHATLAAAFVLFERLGAEGERVVFDSRSGPLPVAREGALLVLDFPSRPAERCRPPPALARALGGRPAEAWRAARDYMAVFDSAAEVRALRPDFGALAALDLPGVIATAPGEEGADFVSRFFCPAMGIPEDPVTGSAHCTLVPYWARRLGRPELRAHQVSARGGELECREAGARVHIGGRAVLYLEGTVRVTPGSAPAS